MKQFGVYLIELNDKQYIGSSSYDMKNRWACHLSDLKKGKHGNKHLQNAFNKYGAGSLRFSVLEIVEMPSQCIVAEQRWIDELKPEYNICPNAGSCLGHKYSEESKQKMRSSATGNKCALGHKLSDEWKRENSERHKGKKLSAGHKQALISANTGRTLSLEMRDKLRIANTGKKHTIGTRQKLSEAGKGNKHALGYKHTDEEKWKMSVTKKSKRTGDTKLTKDNYLSKETKRKYISFSSFEEMEAFNAPNG